MLKIERLKNKKLRIKSESKAQGIKKVLTKLGKRYYY